MAGLAGRWGRPRPAAGDGMILRDRGYLRSRLQENGLHKMLPAAAISKKDFTLNPRRPCVEGTYGEKAGRVFTI